MATTLPARDQRLLAALQCDGRVSAERAAAVLGVPAGTVRRRWAAMGRAGLVRVVAAPAAGWGPSVALVRVRLATGDPRTAAARLLAREGVARVDVAVHGRDLVVVVGPGPPDLVPFRAELGAGATVRDVTTSAVLVSHRDPWQWCLPVLEDGERAALAVAPLPGPIPPVDGTDDRLLRLLRWEGRAPAVTLAARLGMSESAVRRRLRHLGEVGVLRTRAVVDPAVVGLPVDARLRLRVAPGRLDAAGRRLAGHPAVTSAHVTTGTANVHLTVRTATVTELYRFIAGELAALDVDLVESALVRSVEPTALDGRRRVG